MALELGGEKKVVHKNWSSCINDGVEMVGLHLVRLFCPWKRMKS